MIRIALAGLLLAPSGAAEARVLDSVWTDAAVRAFAQRAGKGATANQLPEVRAYDAQGRLLLRALPAGSATIAELRRVQRSPTPIGGENLATALSWLQLRDGAPVAPAIGNARLIVLDYWAEWCAPCKPLSQALDRWLADQPAGTVTLIRAETDFMAAMRDR